MKNNQLYKQISKLNPSNLTEVKNAIKEVMQEIILCGLAKSGFFNKCTFYGGTSLRILYGLSRFSEDLDFTLDGNETSFDFNEYLKYTITELKRYNIDASYNIKNKTEISSVSTAYISSNLNSILVDTYDDYIGSINHNEVIKIKVEVESKVIEGGSHVYKLLVSPSFSQIKTFDLPTLFASKLIALLCRKWGSRVKGRDYYDYLFYVSNSVKINMEYLKNGLIMSKKLGPNDIFDIRVLQNMLLNLFEQVDLNLILLDVEPFVKKEDTIFDGLNKQTLVQTIYLLN